MEDGTSEEGAGVALRQCRSGKSVLCSRDYEEEGFTNEDNLDDVACNIIGSYFEYGDVSDQEEHDMDVNT